MSKEDIISTATAICVGNRTYTGCVERRRVGTAQTDDGAIANNDIRTRITTAVIGDCRIQIAANLITAATAKEQIVASATDNRIVTVSESARSRIGVIANLTGIAKNNIIAAASVNRVLAGVTVDNVITGAGSDSIITWTSSDHGITRIGRQNNQVVASAGLNLISDPRIGDTGKIKHVVTLATQSNDGTID